MNRLLCRRRTEEGSALVMALVFVSLIGLIIAALLSESVTNLRTTQGARKRTDKLFVADAGIEWGVQQTRTNAAACPDSSVGTQVLTSSLDINDMTVEVTCEVIAGALASPAAQQWAVIQTGTNTTPANNALVADAPAGAAAGAIAITGGDVYAAGNLNLTRNVAITQGDLTTNCALYGAQPAQPTIGDPDVWSCTASNPTLPSATSPPTITLPNAPTTPGGFETYTCADGSNWKVYHPGYYDANLDVLGNNYFETGVYYFRGVPSQTVYLSVANGIMLGGHRGSETPAVLDRSCPNDTTAGPLSRAAAGSGVLFVFGGNSSLTGFDTTGSTSIELFSRTGGDTITPGLSIVAATTADVAKGYTPWTTSPSGQVLNLAAATVAPAIHGLVYAPAAPVTLYTRAAAPLMAGVVASKLTVHAGTTGLAAVTAQGRRTLLLTATARSGDAGEIATVQRAVVKIANDPAHTATLRSWRVQ
ncbi:MAG: hypothetical protein ACRD12_09165 [Acidimicrobiales bacterium]